MARQRYLKLPEGFLSMISGLGESATSAVMRLTAAHYLDGVVPRIDEGARLVRIPDDEWQRVLVEIGGFLDHGALRDGHVVLAMVDDAVAKRDAESSARSDAANRRNDEKRFRMVAEGRSEPLTRGRLARTGRASANARDMHNSAKDAQVCIAGESADMHNSASNAQLCIGDGCTVVHNEADKRRDSGDDGCTSVHVDAHLCKSGSTSVHIQEADDVREFAETAEISHSGRVDTRTPLGQSRASRGTTTTYSSTLSEREDYYESRASLSPAGASSDHRGGSSSRVDGGGSARVRDTDHRGRDGRGAGRFGSDDGSSPTEFARNSGRSTQNAQRSPGSGRGSASTMVDAPDRSRQPSGRSLPGEDRRSRSGGGGRSSIEGPSAGPSTVPDALIAEFVDRLRDFGEVSDAAARKAVTDWLERHGADLVRRSFDAVPSKRLDRPVSYVDAVIRKTRQREDDAMPSVPTLRRRGEEDAVRPSSEVGQGADASVRPGGRPKPVKRYIKPALNARWELLGWSAMGENGTTDDLETRRIAWRTDAGTVKFLRAEDEVVPEFSEDPGIYLID